MPVALMLGTKFGTVAGGGKAKKPSQPGRRAGRGLQNKQQQQTPVDLVGLGETLSGNCNGYELLRCAALRCQEPLLSASTAATATGKTQLAVCVCTGGLLFDTAAEPEPQQAERSNPP